MEHFAAELWLAISLWFFIHLFWKKTFAFKWHRFLHGPDFLSVI